MSLLFWSAMGILALNAVLLLFLLLRSHPPVIYVLPLMPELRPVKPGITPHEFRRTAWKSWLNAHPDTNPLDKDRARWVIEKEAHRLERINRQPHPFADTQRPRR